MRGALRSYVTQFAATMYSPHLKAARIVAENVTVLLKARGQNQAELAQWCRHSGVWVSQFLTGKRSWQLDDLDRIADFFGIATYQLFQPGISSLTERRIADRRSLRERRIGHQQRLLGALRADIDAAHPHAASRGRDVQTPISAARRRLIDEFERRLAALLSPADAGRQAPTARVAGTRVSGRHRAARGSDPPKT
jgi:hypothetical protein